ncbi:MAG: outer membrane integrity protein, partial [Bacteroidetes bacterium]|nr:outer membrane integrity protein [Bacteroidota bacterium]
MKFLKVVGIALLVLFVILFSLPFLYKGKIVAATKKAVNEKLNAKVDFNEEIGLSLFSSFPNLSLSIKDFRIINFAPFEGDTLFAAQEISAVLDVMSIIRGEQIQVRSIV